MLPVRRYSSVPGVGISCSVSIRAILSTRSRQGTSCKSAARQGRLPSMIKFSSSSIRVAVYGFLFRDGLPAHTLRPFYCFDFLARISHQPFVKNVPQRGKIIVALCAVHSVIDSDKADAFLWENHFRIHSHLQIVSP